jgi:hypothetical protein
MTVTGTCFGISTDGETVSLAGVVGALGWIVNNMNLGTTVVNCSANSTDANTFNTDVAITTLTQKLYNGGSLLYNSAGNSALADNSPPMPGLIRVAAVDQAGNLASFSNYGSYITCAAAGVNVPAIHNGTPIDTLVTWNGTSFSSPYFAGSTLCLMRKGLTAVQAHNIIMQTASTYAQSTGGALAVPNLQAAYAAAP